MSIDPTQFVHEVKVSFFSARWEKRAKGRIRERKKVRESKKKRKKERRKRRRIEKERKRKRDGILLVFLLWPNKKWSGII